MPPRNDPVWLEVALNGPWPPGRQPHVPVQVKDIVAEGIACVEAGAAILHVHARDPESGRQRDDPDLYAAIIEGIRAHADAIIYPTIPAPGPADSPGDDDGKSRYACIAALARRGLLEWAPIDPGSMNFAHEEGLLRDIAGSVYVNPERPLRGHHQNVRARWMWTRYIELVVDGKVVDLNRIPLDRLMFIGATRGQPWHPKAVRLEIRPCGQVPLQRQM